MIGLGKELSSPTTAWWPHGAVYAADFTANRYMREREPITAADAFLFTRASTKLAENTSGTWIGFAENILARTNKGALLEPAETYYPTNSTLSGAVIGILGAGGQLPTGWVPSSWTQVEVVELGLDQGLQTITLDLSADNSGSGSSIGRGIQFSNITIPPNSTGDFWTSGIYCTTDTIFGDDTCSATSNITQLQERTAGGSFLNNSGGVLNLVQDLSLRQPRTKIITAASAELIHLFYTWNNILAGELFHRRITLKMPTLTNSGIASSPMPTDSGTSVRNADALTLHLPAGLQELTLTLEDASTVVIPDVSGDYLVRTDLGKVVERAVSV